MNGDRRRSRPGRHGRGGHGDNAVPDPRTPRGDAGGAADPPPDLVFALAFHTWSDAAGRAFSWSADAMAQALTRDPDRGRTVIANPWRSAAGLVRRRRGHRDAGFPDTQELALYQPLRLRRGDPSTHAGLTRSYLRLDARLARYAVRRGLREPVLVTCHPVHAAVAHRSRWSDVVYYAWDDWLSFPPFSAQRSTYAWAYREIAARDTNVVGVTTAIADRIQARRSTVVPNGIHAADFESLPPVPSWYAALPRPLGLYAGSIEERVDLQLVAMCARALPGWSFVLVGHQENAGLTDALRALPNVVLGGHQPRSRVLAMMAGADVGLIPHRDTPMTRAMSPLKLYEYLAAGVPVVASDLAPVRGVSDRCLLAGNREEFVAAVPAAAALGACDPAELRDFRLRHDWASRYRVWKTAVLPVAARRLVTDDGDQR